MKVASIKDLCLVFGDGDWIESKDQSDTGIRLIQTGNIGSGVFKDRIERARWISDDTFRRLRCTEIGEGDVLISRLPDPVGRACILPALEHKAITAVDCSIVRFDEKVMNPRYFVYYSQSPAYASAIEPLISGSTRQRISREKLGTIQIPLPSLEKQREIVEKLDNAFVELEILIQNSSQQISNETELLNQEIDRLLEPVQKGWTSKKLSDWCDFIGTGPFGSAVHKADYVKDGIPLVNPSNIGDGFIIHENIKGVSNKKAQELLSYKLKSGDVVLGRRGEMGRCAIVSKAEENWICGTGSFFLRPDKECHAELLVRILRSERVRTHLERISTGVTMSNLNNKAVGAIPLSLPEKAVQESVLFKINELESAISLLRHNTQRKIDALGKFQNSLLVNVFRSTA